MTDVQGWYNDKSKRALLTDPCVHCIRKGLLDDDFKDYGLTGESFRLFPFVVGGSVLGMKVLGLIQSSFTGMKAFFESHNCGPACKALGLDGDISKIMGQLRGRIVAMLEAEHDDDSLPLDAPPIGPTEFVKREDAAIDARRSGTPLVRPIQPHSPEQSVSLVPGAVYKCRLSAFLRIYMLIRPGNPLLNVFTHYPFLFG